MRLFLDTNVLISAILFPNGTASEFLRHAINHHTIVIGDYVIEEIHEVFRRKFPNHLSDLDEFFTEFSYEKAPLPTRGNAKFPLVRDPKDNPIVATAIDSRCDYLITGDKDILEMGNMDSPTAMGPGEFLSHARQHTE